MRLKLVLAPVLAGFIGATVNAAQAQPGNASGSSLSLFPRGDLIRLFGGHRTFSAEMIAEVTPGSGGQEPHTMQMDFAMLNGTIRVEVQTSQILGEQGVLGSAESLKRLGMERQVNLIQPEDQTIYLLYPGLEGYIEVPFPRNERGLKPEQIEVQKRKVSEETVAGHPCIKNEVTLTHPNGKARQALVWQATDLAQFPIRIELEHRGAALQLNYREIRFRRPDRELFRVPSRYTKHEDMRALTRVAIQKLYGANGLQDILPPQK